MSDPERAAHWSGSGYVQQSAHHRALDEWFLARHPPARTDVVVDLGCGSGEFSARLAALVPQGRVIGVDPDSSMLAAAQRHKAAPHVPASACGAGRQDRSRLVGGSRRQPGDAPLAPNLAISALLPGRVSDPAARRMVPLRVRWRR